MKPRYRAEGRPVIHGTVSLHPLTARRCGTRTDAQPAVLEPVTPNVQDVESVHLRAAVLLTRTVSAVSQVRVWPSQSHGSIRTVAVTVPGFSLYGEPARVALLSVSVIFWALVRLEPGALNENCFGVV